MACVAVGLVLLGANLSQLHVQPPTGVKMPAEVAEHGRGLALIRLMVDGLTYHHDGSQNVWQISRSRRSPAATD